MIISLSVSYLRKHIQMRLFQLKWEFKKYERIGGEKMKLPKKIGRKVIEGKELQLVQWRAEKL